MAAAADERWRLSVIIPTLNEAGEIPATLQALQELRDRGHEVIVVDGGSEDRTVELSRALADRVLDSEAGRALQMRTGATVAGGTVFWFLHADTQAPPQADRLIRQALQQGLAGWGYFDIRFQDTCRLLKCVAWTMNLRTRLSGIVTGDQGLFITRDLYERADGFPAIPLMEDIAFSSTLRRYTRPANIRRPLFTSPRRWLKHGILRTILRMWALRLAYFMGVRPEHLAAFYATHRP